MERNRSHPKKQSHFESLDLNVLLSRITPDNLHSEVEFGSRVGKEYLNPNSLPYTDAELTKDMKAHVSYADEQPATSNTEVDD